MSKQISAHELAAIVTKLLTATAGTDELSGAETFGAFMTAIAGVVCDHCGGEVHHPADNIAGDWLIGIHGNDSMPDAFGGIWREYDKDGQLFDGVNHAWPATFGDGTVCHNQVQLDAYLAGIQPIAQGGELDTTICFAVGALSREQLEATAEHAEVDFEDRITSDELRALVLEAARAQGGVMVFDSVGGTTTYGFNAVQSAPMHLPVGAVPMAASQHG